MTSVHTKYRASYRQRLWTTDTSLVVEDYLDGTEHDIWLTLKCGPVAGVEIPLSPFEATNLAAVLLSHARKYNQTDAPERALWLQYWRKAKDIRSVA